MPTIITAGDAVSAASSFAAGNDGLLNIVVGPAGGKLTALSIDAAGQVSLPRNYYGRLVEQFASGTNGGTNTTGSYFARAINTVNFESRALATIASSSVSFAESGTFQFRANATARGVDRHKIRLQNTTLGTTLGIGTSQTANGTTQVENQSFVEGRFTYVAGQLLQLQHRTETSVATIGLGVAASFGDAETYAVIEFWKVG